MTRKAPEKSGCGAGGIRGPGKDGVRQVVLGLQAPGELGQARGNGGTWPDVLAGGGGAKVCTS